MEVRPVGIKERREREKLATRQLILDAARDLFVEDGYDAVTMRKIAEKVEYSPTAIYLHFADKDALMVELSVCDFQAFTNAFGQVPDDLDPAMRLRGLGYALIRFALEHPNQYRLLFMTPRPQPTEEEIARKPAEDAYDLLIRTVHRAMDAGVIHGDRDPHEAAQTLWGSLHGIVALHLVMPTKSRVPMVPIQQLADSAIDLLMTGLRAPPTR